MIRSSSHEPDSDVIVSITTIVRLNTSFCGQRDRYCQTPEKHTDTRDDNGSWNQFPLDRVGDREWKGKNSVSLRM